MRQVGKLDNELHAATFRDFLFSKGIEAEIEKDSQGAWSVWVHDEDRLGEASGFLKSFTANPGDRVYGKAADEGAERRLAESKKNVVDSRRVLASDFAEAYGLKNFGFVTFFLIATSVMVTILLNTRFGDAVFRNLAIFGPLVLSGEIWRLVTPAFMHFGILHVLFNMLWLKDLGGMIESIKGSLFLTLFVVLVSGVSNVAQYLVSGPSFGGMSGVVYGLLGYVWMQSRVNPWSGFVMHSFTMQMMLVWLILGFTGAIGGIANTTHAAGLIMGICWGYLDGRRRLS